MSDEIIEKTFQVTSPARLIISNVRGSVTVQPGSEGLIEVKAVKHNNFDSGNTIIEMAQDADGTVRVETRMNDVLFGFLSHPPRVDYTVQAPQGVHLDVSCVSSSIDVSGLEGVFKLKTISGSMDIVGLSGPLKLGAVSGDITGSKLSGVLDLNTVSGRVHLTESSFPSADGSTVSGDLVLQTALADGPYKFGSVSGSVKLMVPVNTRCNVELNSVSGSIRSSLPATSTTMGHGMKVTQIQGGGTMVRLKSVSGSVSIETEGTVATAVTPTASAYTNMIPPIPPIPPIPSIPAVPSTQTEQSYSTSEEANTSTPEKLSTAEILQRIERGEMTVDEAIKLMKDQS